MNCNKSMSRIMKQKMKKMKKEDTMVIDNKEVAVAGFQIYVSYNDTGA